MTWSLPKLTTSSKIVEKLTNLSQWLILLSLPLVLFDNLRFPLISSKEILSVLGVVVILLLIILILVKRNTALNLPMCFFFLWVSLSSLQNSVFVSNSVLFLYLFSFVFFQLNASIKKDSVFFRRFIYLCFFIGIVSSFISLVAIIFPNQYLLYIRNLFPNSIGQVVYDYDRGRIKNLVPLDLLAPYSLAIPNLQLLPVLLLVSSLGASAYRSRILMGIVGVFVCTLLFKKNIIPLIVISCIVVLLSLTIFPSSFYKRFTLENQIDSLTIRGRIGLAQKAYQIGRSNPVFGVGIGNYQGYVLSTIHFLHPESSTYENPHNYLLQIMAETGLVGMFFYVLMMLSFLINDAKNMYSYTNYEKMISISSFLFVFGSNFDWYSAHNLLYFFILRGMLVPAK